MRYRDRFSRLALIPPSRFPAFFTGSFAEEASLAAHCNHVERVFTIARTRDHFGEKHTSASLVIIVLLRKTWLISESLSGDNGAASVDGFCVPQHQKLVLVKNLRR
jgi:hypothetical protein